MIIVEAKIPVTEEEFDAVERAQTKKRRVGRPPKYVPESATFNDFMERHQN